MRDHEARAKVRQAVVDYLSDRIASFAFADKLHEIGSTTEDQTVKYVTSKLWHTYSDTTDHLVHLDKRSWDAVQRLLLLLDSDAELRETRTWIWHSSQLVAAATLIVEISVIWLIVPLFVGGAISMALASTRRRVQSSYESPDPLNAWPFPSLGAIKRAIARSPGFRKQRHRADIVNRRAESRFGYLRLPQIIEWPLSRLGWCLISPIILALQCLPLHVSQEYFSEPHSATTDAA